jgi:DNA-binding transcriptional LysR family regulator
VNIRQIEIFRAVMLAGSASRAAERLGITQPAVSRAVAELEHSAGFLLFERVRGRLVPTAEARLLVGEVDRSFVGMDRIRAEAARIRDFGSGSLRVATLSAMAASVIPRAIRLFHARNPDIVLTLQIHPTATVRDMVAGGLFDLGLVADEADLSGVEHKAFGAFPAVCVLPPGHRLAARPSIGARDLDGERFLALAPEDRLRRRLDALLEAEDVHPRIVVETPASSTICALAREGVGIGLANPMAIEGFAGRGLEIRPFTPALAFRSLMIFRPDAQKSRLVKAFVAALGAACRSAHGIAGGAGLASPAPGRSGE